MRLAVGHICGIVNVVVAQPAADGLKAEPRDLAGNAFFQFLRQARQLCLGLADLLLQAGALVVDQRLLVSAVKTRRQRAADLVSVSAQRRLNLHRGKERLHAVKIIDRDGVVFVVVTLSATHREPEENRADRRGHLAKQLVAGAIPARLGERCQPQERQRHGALGVHPR